MGAASSDRAPVASWIAALATSILMLQSFAVFAAIDLSNARQLSTVGSISGAAIGGLLLGIGIALARGCPSRQIVLAAGGNIRAFITLIFVGIGVDLAVRGKLASTAVYISGLWRVEATNRAAMHISRFSVVFMLTAVLVLGSLHCTALGSACSD